MAIQTVLFVSSFAKNFLCFTLVSSCIFGPCTIVHQHGAQCCGAGGIKLKDMSRKKKIESVARGYRLKPETHRLIRLVKENLGISHDKIINDALKLYYIELRKSHKIT